MTYTDILDDDRLADDLLGPDADPLLRDRLLDELADEQQEAVQDALQEQLIGRRPPSLI